jgi:hypothetical protein
MNPNKFLAYFKKLSPFFIYGNISIKEIYIKLPATNIKVNLTEFSFVAPMLSPITAPISAEKLTNPFRNITCQGLKSELSNTPVSPISCGIS